MPDDISKQDIVPADQAPFVIEHRQEDRGRGGTFRPSARLVLTDRVRTSGLWRTLTPEDAKTLVFLLTFITPNGWCRPTLPELAEAMGTSQAQGQGPPGPAGPGASGRGSRSPSCWRGRTAWTPTCPDAASWTTRRSRQPEPPQAAPLRTPGREAVVAYSRARYAKTREEVERQIGEMMGWGPPAFAGDDPAVAEVKRKAFKAMTDLGMPKEQALDLLTRFELGEIERQVAWLPSRNAKNPARFLAAAIEGGLRHAR